MRKRIALLLAAVCTMVVFGGCQSTPDREAVVVKGANQAQKTAQEQSAPPDYTFTAPETYKKELSSPVGKLEITIDADVVVPGDTYPVQRVSPRGITQEQAADIAEVFFPGQTPHLTQTSEFTTKAEIEEELVYLKMGETDLAEEDRAAYDEMVQEDIAALEEMYKTAPEEYVPIEWDGSFRPQPQPNPMDPYPYSLIHGDDVQTINIEATGASGNSARLMVEVDGRNHSAFEYVERREGESIGEPGDSVVQPLEQARNLPTLPLEQAREQAVQCVEALGLTEYALAAEGAALTGLVPQGVPDAQFEDYPKCYVFQFTRVDELPVNYVSNLLQTDYTLAWDYEALTVMIDDEGLCRVLYRSPYTVDEVIAENVELLEFDEITRRIEENLLRLFDSSEQPEITACELRIDTIQLGLGRIAQNEDFSTCLMVPVWDVYGPCTITYEDGEVTTTFDLGLSNLTLNAMDGSIINRTFGY